MVMVDLRNYKIDGQEINVKAELASVLQIAGVYLNGDQLCAGMDLVSRISDPLDKSNEINLNDDEFMLIKQVLNILMTKSTPLFGGPKYNELIMRVFKAGK